MMRVQFLSILAFCAVGWADDGQTKWTAPVESQPTAVRGEQVSQAAAQPALKPSDMNAGPNPVWIWGEDNQTDYMLRTTFDVKSVAAARLMASCDNVGAVFVNGQKVADSSEWQEPMNVDVTKYIKAGTNQVSASVRNQGGIAAFVLKLVVKDQQGNLQHVVSNTDWTIPTKNLDNDRPAVSRGNYGEGPWGRVFNRAADAGRIPRGTFEVLPGYRVDKLFSVPKEELGSWVCITFDHKGRLIASDQGAKGICRITLPPVETLTDSKVKESVETVVEHLDFSKCEFQPSGAQGMLWAFDSLYFSCNGGPGSGLYRARDTDGDDQFDECIKLKAFRGGGEHGPHSLRLSPDGKRIFVIAGNHTDPPFKAGEERDNKNYSSRVPTNWGEDLLLPRMWDANGHARGKLAPGGWIASTDADGKTWEIWSIGYRNPYDMAFNADGELFAYDADMEWDVGMPWYRPTRVVHATSGSEFGWRSGSGKWPDYYLDSLPAMVNIGPGSPVGVDFGYGPPRKADSEAANNAWARVKATGFGSDRDPAYVFTPLAFPKKYQKALYICDWTFGTMYAIHTEPHNSSYKATKEEFLSRTPLPLTDVAAGPDGALYFTIGGRGTESELYRVVYEGEVAATEATFVDSNNAEERDLRKRFETLHPSNGTIPLSDQYEDFADNDVIQSDDYFLRTASRNAFYNSEIFKEISSVSFLSDDSLDSDEQTKSGYEEAIVAYLIARGPLDRLPSQPNPEIWKTTATTFVWKQFQRVDFRALSERQKLDYLRALSVSLVRLGKPDNATCRSIVARLEKYYLTGLQNVDRELCQVLVFLGSEKVVERTILQLSEDAYQGSTDDDMADLLSRNSRYASAIKASISNPPDKQQIWYAYCLRVADVGWTPELRADFYRWFGRAKQWSGGNSFRKFLQNMEDEAWSKTPFDDRVLIEAAGARTPYKVPELPKPVGPGKQWTQEEVVALAKAGLKKRNFKNGQQTFAATRCIVCHRFGGDGGATGPDLTQLAGRFSIESLTEAIVHPSKVISDQYKASTVVTNRGKAYTGRIVSETDDQISILTDPEDSTKIVDIAKADIDEQEPSSVSIMPKDLLNQLNENEVLDLLAYLLSRGNEKDAMFRK